MRVRKPGQTLGSFPWGRGRCGELRVTRVRVEGPPGQWVFRSQTCRARGRLVRGSCLPGGAVKTGCAQKRFALAGADGRRAGTVVWRRPQTLHSRYCLAFYWLLPVGVIFYYPRSKLVETSVI